MTNVPEVYSLEANVILTFLLTKHSYLQKFLWIYIRQWSNSIIKLNEYIQNTNKIFLKSAKFLHLLLLHLWIMSQLSLLCLTSSLFQNYCGLAKYPKGEYLGNAYACNAAQPKHCKNCWIFLSLQIKATLTNLCSFVGVSCIKVSV